jgi:hypothetical protein
MERGGFEPPKAYAGRFTVCSLWPLGHLSASFQASCPGTGADEFTHGADGRSRTDDLLITSQLLYLLSYIGRLRRAPPECAVCRSNENFPSPDVNFAGHTATPPIALDGRP